LEFSLQCLVQLKFTDWSNFAKLRNRFTLNKNIMKNFDKWISALRSDEFKELKCRGFLCEEINKVPHYTPLGVACELAFRNTQKVTKKSRTYDDAYIYNGAVDASYIPYAVNKWLNIPSNMIEICRSLTRGGSSHKEIAEIMCLMKNKMTFK